MKSIQLLKEARPSMAAEPGHPKRIGYEYERNGTANLFLFCEPLAEWRQTQVTDRRTKADWAKAVRDLLDGRYAEAHRVVLVLDNLNIHSIGSLYEAFPPAEARRLAQRLGSWLNIAENELSALTRQCLSRRLGTIDQMASELAAWDEARNRDAVRVNWRFSIEQARVKLRHVYPQFQS